MPMAHCLSTRCTSAGNRATEVLLHVADATLPLILRVAEDCFVEENAITRRLFRDTRRHFGAA
jgi:hypothetical protein